MIRHKLIRRLTAALVSGAMALSLCAPALAAADEPAATLQPGTYPEGSIAVVYKDKENPIVVSENTPDILGDGTLAYADGVLSSTKTIEGLYIDVNPEKTVDIDITVEDGPAVKTVLNTANVHNMTLSGYVPNGPAVNTVYAGCTGSLTVENTAEQGNAAQKVMFINQSSSEMVLRLSDYLERLLAPGEMYRYLMKDGPITTLTRSITIKAEPTYTLTVENGYAVNDRTGQVCTRFYRGELVEVHVERPADALELDHWVLPEGLELEGNDPPECLFYMPDEDITVGASWKKAENTEMELHVTYNDYTEVFTPQHLKNNSNADVTFANDTFTIRFDFTMDHKDVKIQGLADPKTGTVPSVVLNGIVMGSVYADGVKNVTLQGDYDGNLVHDDVMISASGDVTITNESGSCVRYDLTVYNAQNVTVTANTPESEDSDSDDYAVNGDAKITCTGDAVLTNTGGGVVGDSLLVHDAQDVTLDGRYDSYLVYNDADIACRGNVEITNPIGGGVWEGLTVYAAQDVTVRADSEERCAVEGAANITCTGDVTLTNTSGQALNYLLTIAGARNVTIIGKTDGDKLIGHNNGDEHIIQCSGTVTLRNEGTGGLFTNQLTYTPDDSVEVYDIAVDGEVKREGATDAVVLTCGKNVTVITSDVTDPDAPDAPEWNNDLTGAKELIITPTLKPVDPGEAADGDGSAVVAVVAGTALAGAAIYGGYEVATRVILHDLLPEGTAIPATRGELALLLWNAAGRPEAGAVVTVYPDITDADQQAAARWCTEQGLLTARSDGTFAPDGRVPKWRVIEVWNHAFAK